jgi:hypothetical protein
MLSCRLESKDTFYSTLCEWWTDWKFPVVAITSLPERIFVVSNDGVDLYAIPVYFGDSDLCWIGFVTGNKKSTKVQRNGALEYLLDMVELHMKGIGARIAMTVSGTPVLKRLYETSDYTVSAKGINEYIKKI